MKKLCICRCNMCFIWTRLRKVYYVTYQAYTDSTRTLFSWKIMFWKYHSVCHFICASNKTTASTLRFSRLRQHYVKIACKKVYTNQTVNVYIYIFLKTLCTVITVFVLHITNIKTTEVKCLQLNMLSVYNFSNVAKVLDIVACVMYYNKKHHNASSEFFKALRSLCSATISEFWDVSLCSLVNKYRILE